MDQSVSIGTQVAVKPLAEIPENEWLEACKRYLAILPILNNELGISVAQIAREAKVTRPTIYKWVDKYRQTGAVIALVDPPKTGGKGKSRKTDELEDIIESIINERYLNQQKLTIKKASIDIALKCRAAGIQVPHYNTIRKRINQISEEIKLARRYHANIARDKFHAIDGSFPEADYPLAAVQIDHTPLDILVVDEVLRQPVGKPWLTMAIDVYSRMVVGFYISLDPPGALGTGLCLSHAILPKALWLNELEVAGKWPCQGFMKSIYLDNAAEFRGKMIERACQQYGIELNFRPVATPNYGGHIERLMGTVLSEIHALPGTTFSKPSERKYYDAEGKACFTLQELEKWLATFIVGIYHQRLHTSINTTPLVRYNESIAGGGSQRGIGQSRAIEDERTLRLDFMPFVERTIQRYGISIDGIWYYGDVLRKWIYTFNDPNARYRSLKKFIIKRDPRDISMVFFYDPELKDYFEIPYRNTSHPSITIWEHKKILRVMKERGIANVDENAIFDTYEQLRQIEDQAKGNTVAVKRRHRNETRKRYANDNSMKNEFVAENNVTQVIPPTIDFTKKYLPFEDIEG